MRNRYEVRGDHAVIFLHRRDGSFIETCVDLAGLEKAKTLPGTWGAFWSPAHKAFRVQGTVGRQFVVFLHRYLTDCPTHLQVDHINHDTLDNRGRNLRCVTQHVNMLNRKGTTSLSRTGLRGVQIERSGRWRARVKVNGRTVSLGTYVEQADAAAAVTRKLRELGVPASAAADEPGETPPDDDVVEKMRRLEAWLERRLHPADEPERAAVSVRQGDSRGKPCPVCGYINCPGGCARGGVSPSGKEQP